jgi:hypothetical protein
MSKKKRTSLEAIFDEAAEEARPPAASAAPVTDRGEPSPRQEPAGERPRRRTFEAQHKKQSVYLTEPVWEQLRKLAFDERCKMHDYLMEGLDSVFRKRGLPSIAELEKELEEEDA